MDPCIKQAPVLSKRFWIILWPLAYNRLELDCIRKIINFWYTFGWKWRVFVTIWDCRTHVRMMSMTSSVERTDLDFKISVALGWIYGVYQNQSAVAYSFLFFSFSNIQVLKFSSHFSQELWDLDGWSLLHTWTMGGCITCTRIRRLLHICPFIFSFFFLSNFQTLKCFCHTFLRNCEA